MHFCNRYFPNNDWALYELDFSAIMFNNYIEIYRIWKKLYRESPEVDDTRISLPNIIFNEEEKEKVLAPAKIIITKEHMFSCFYT